MKVAIIGGGITGLALGWNLKKKGIDFTLFEKNNRTGGVITSIQRDGFLFEKGPHSCRTRGGRATLELVEELGLEQEVISASPAAKKRYFYSQGKFKQVPSCPVSFLLSPWRMGVLKALWNDWRTPPGDGNDESIYQFVCRRLNVQLAEEIFDPFVTGIFAGDIRNLSIQACFPIMSSWEREHGGLIKGLLATRKKQKKSADGSPFIQKMLKTSLFSFRGGMQTLTNKLEEKLRSHIQLNKEASKLEKKGEKWEISFKDGSVQQFDRLFLTIPASEASLLLPHIPELSQIDYQSLAIVNLGYRKPVLKREGFGYLIPSSEKKKVMGVLWDSSVFPQQNYSPQETRFTVMLRPGDEPFKSVEEALERHLGIKEKADVTSLYFADRAIPQYTVGHLEKVRKIESALPPSLTLLGSSYRTLSVNECIAAGLNPTCHL